MRVRIPSQCLMGYFFVPIFVEVVPFQHPRRPRHIDISHTPDAPVDFECHLQPLLAAHSLPCQKRAGLLPVLVPLRRAVAESLGDTLDLIDRGFPVRTGIDSALVLPHAEYNHSNSAVASEFLNLWY